MNPGQRELEACILALLDERRPGASICPSEAARRASPANWRALMPGVRQAAAALAERGLVECTQGGQVVDAGALRGPYRLRLSRRDPAQCL